MKYLAVIAMFALAGCAGTQKEPVEALRIDAKPLERPALNLPPIDQVRARDVEWIIITPENADQVFADIRDGGDAVVVFALTPEDYENLSLNTREALQIILQQQAVINGYRRYYLTTSREIDEHNRSLNE